MEGNILPQGSLSHRVVHGQDCFGGGGGAGGGDCVLEFPSFLFFVK